MATDLARPARRLGPWIPFLMVACAALMAHGLALRADFFMDDKPHILLNDHVQEGLGAPQKFQKFKSRHLTYAIWRGVHLTFGPNKMAYHAVNLLLHVGVACLFLAVARRVLNLHAGLKSEQRESAARWGALLFAVHPLVSEPVNYAAQTSMLLLTLFGTLALYLFLRWHETKRSRYLAGMALALVLSSHAKEPGIVHAAIPLLFIGALFVSLDAFRRTLVTSHRARWACIVGGGALAVVLASSWMINAYFFMSDLERFSHHALTQARVLFGYLWRVFLPLQLSSDHHIPWTTSWADVPAVLGLVVVVAGGLALLYLALSKRSWWAAVGGIALFHLVARFGHPVDELMVEYRMYPSMPWIALLLALGVTQLLDGYKRTELPWLRPAVLTTLVGGCIALSAMRSWTWGDEDRLVRDVIRHYPHNLRAWSIHLSHLAERGEFERLSEMRNVPQQIAMSLIPPRSGKPAVRQFTGEKTYKNYVACQYPLIKALVHTGQVDEAVRRADILLVDVLTKSPTKNHKSVFTALLAKLICHAAKGEDAVIDETILAVRPHYDDDAKLRHSLAVEAQSLPKFLATAAVESED